MILPGQYFDEETGLHYNYFRDYDPITGRYVESDPIGLASGLNTYLYTEANPLALTDPLGLQVRPPPRGRGIRSPMTVEQATAAVRVPRLVEQIRRFDPEFRYVTVAPRNWRYGRQDVDTLTNILRQDQTSCTAEPRINYGSTPEGRPFTRHYGAETGPVRNIPGSIVDAVINGTTPRPGRAGTSVYYDPINNVTVVTGASGIASARKGPPTSGTQQ